MTDTEPEVVVVVDQSANGPSDAGRDPVACAVAEVAAGIGRAVGERIVLDATGICDAALSEFVERVRAQRSLRPLNSLRLEPSRVLAVLAEQEELPATVLTATAPEQSRQVAEYWRRDGAPVCLITVTGGPARFVIAGRRLVADAGGAGV